MLLSTHADDFSSRKKTKINFLTIDHSAMLLSARRSLLSPGTAQMQMPLSALTENFSGMLQNRKSSVFEAFASKEPQQQHFNFQNSALGIAILGKMKHKAQQTKQFIKSHTNPKRDLINLSIRDSEIAKVFI